ncbi:MAG TPA: dephospho-CoA kinase, partial [Nitrospiria bacterium]|nr:dephospho-CoA kinase [Nitrospiria bacterium]
RGSAAYDHVLSLFGKDILDPDGEIDRKRLGKIVFDDPNLLLELNRIVHPVVFEAWRLEKEKIAGETPDAVVIFEVPLLVESGAHRMVDRVIVVRTERETQIRRLMSRDQISRKEAEKRIDAQMSLEEKLRFADAIIDGDRDLDEVRKQVDKIYEELKRMSGERRDNMEKTR